MSKGEYTGGPCLMIRLLLPWSALIISAAASAQEVRHYDGRCTNTTVGQVARISIDMRIGGRTIGGELHVSPPLGGSGAFSGSVVNGTCSATSVTGIKFSGKCDGQAFDPIFSVGNEVGYCVTRLAGQLDPRPAPNPPGQQPAPIGTEISRPPARDQPTPVGPLQPGPPYPDAGPRRE